VVPAVGSFAISVRIVVGVMTAGVSVTVGGGVVEAGKMPGLFKPASGVKGGGSSVGTIEVGVGGTPQMEGTDPQADNINDKIMVNAKKRCIR